MTIPTHFDAHHTDHLCRFNGPVIDGETCPACGYEWRLYDVYDVAA